MPAPVFRRVGNVTGPVYARAAATRASWLVAFLITSHALATWMTPADACASLDATCSLPRLVEVKLMRPVAVLAFVVSLSSLTVRRLRDAGLPASLIILFASFLLKDVGTLTGIIPMSEQAAGQPHFLPGYLLAAVLSFIALLLVPSATTQRPSSRYGRLGWMTLGVAVVLMVGPDLATLAWVSSSTSTSILDQGWLPAIILALQWRLTLNGYVLAGVGLFGLCLAAMILSERRRSIDGLTSTSTAKPHADSPT